jgi:hypothetical protein
MVCLGRAAKSLFINKLMATFCRGHPLGLPKKQFSYKITTFWVDFEGFGRPGNCFRLGNERQGQSPLTTKKMKEAVLHLLNHR